MVSWYLCCVVTTSAILRRQGRKICSKNWEQTISVRAEISSVILEPVSTWIQ